MQSRMPNPVFILPEAMQAMFALNKATEGKLPLRIRKLVHLRASQINGCSVCVDMHAKELQHDGAPLDHIFAVAAWRETPFFSDAERAALELTENLTRLRRSARSGAGCGVGESRKALQPARDRGPAGFHRPDQQLEPLQCRGPDDGRREVGKSGLMKKAWAALMPRRALAPHTASGAMDFVA